MQDTKIIAGIGVITLIIVIIAAFFLGNGSSTPTSATSSVDSPKADINKLVSKESFQTNPGAKVTIVEFADFQCPGCGAMHPVLKELMNQEGKNIDLVYREFPLPMHSNAKIAAQAANAAAKQGKFWEMHDMLFENQDTWAPQKETDAQKTFDGYAQKLHLDLSKFDQDSIAQTTVDRMNRDLADGNSLGVNSTPTFFINQHKYLGEYSIDGLKSVVDQDLKAPSAKTK